MKISEYTLKSIVLSRVDDLISCIINDKTNNYLHVRACLSEALTFAMQLNLLEPIKATELGAKADAHICNVYKVNHINSVKSIIVSGEKQLQPLKDALLLLEREKDIFSNHDLQDLIDQVYMHTKEKDLPSAN